MKLNSLKYKILEIIKNELKDEQNLIILNDAMKPILHNIIYSLYPYIILFSIIIISILLLLVIILFNIK